MAEPAGSAVSLGHLCYDTLLLLEVSGRRAGSPSILVLMRHLGLDSEASTVDAAPTDSVGPAQGRSLLSRVLGQAVVGCPAVSV